MNAKELLQMNDRMIAFNALIKGDLAKEIKEAKEALAALDNAQSLAGAQAKIDADLVAYNTYVDNMTVIFDKTNDELNDREADLDQRQSDLTEKAAKLDKEVRDVEQVRSQLEGEKEAAVISAQISAKALAEQWATLKVEQDNLKDAQVDVARREVKVAEKLAAIKALAK